MNRRWKPCRALAARSVHAVVDGIAFGIALATFQLLLMLGSLNPAF